MAYIPVSDTPSAFIMGGDSDAVLLDMMGTYVLLDGGKERLNLVKHVRPLEANVVSAPTLSAASNAALLNENADTFVPLIGNFPTVKNADGNQVKELLRKIRSRADSQGIPIQTTRYNAKYEPILISKSSRTGRLELYVLSGEPKEIEALEKAVEHGDEQLLEKAVMQNGLISILVWFPAKDNEPIKRILHTGTASYSRIVSALEKAKHLPFLHSPNLTTAKAFLAVPSPASSRPAVSSSTNKTTTTKTTSSSTTKAPLTTKNPVTVKSNPVRPTTTTAASTRPAPSSRLSTTPSTARAAPKAVASPGAAKTATSAAPKKAVTAPTRAAPITLANKKPSPPVASTKAAEPKMITKRVTDASAAASGTNGRHAATSKPTSKAVSKPPTAKSDAPASSPKPVDTSAHRASKAQENQQQKDALEDSVEIIGEFRQQQQQQQQQPPVAVVDLLGLPGQKPTRQHGNEMPESPVELVVIPPTPDPGHVDNDDHTAPVTPDIEQAPEIPPPHQEVSSTSSSADKEEEEEAEERSLDHSGPSNDGSLPSFEGSLPSVDKPFFLDSSNKESYESAKQNVPEDPGLSTTSSSQHQHHIVEEDLSKTTDSTASSNIEEPREEHEQSMQSNHSAEQHQQQQQQCEEPHENKSFEPSEATIDTTPKPVEDEHHFVIKRIDSIPEEFKLPLVPQPTDEKGLLDGLEEQMKCMKISMDTDELKQALCEEGDANIDATASSLVADDNSALIGASNMCADDQIRKISEQLFQSATTPFTTAMATAIFDGKEPNDQLGAPSVHTTTPLDDRVEDVSEKVNPLITRSSVVEENDGKIKYEEPDPVIDSVLESVASHSEDIDNKMSNGGHENVATEEDEKKNVVEPSSEAVDDDRFKDALPSHSQVLHLPPTKAPRVATPRLSRSLYFELAVVPHQSSHCTLPDEIAATDYFSTIRSSNYILFSQDVAPFVLDGWLSAKRQWNLNGHKSRLVPTVAHPNLSAFDTMHKSEMEALGLILNSAVENNSIKIASDDDKKDDYQMIKIAL